MLQSKNKCEGAGVCFWQMKKSTVTAEKINTLTDITGVWNMQLDFRGYTNSQGAFKERLSSEQWMINLSQSGNAVLGTLLLGTASRLPACQATAKFCVWRLRERLMLLQALIVDFQNAAIAS